MSAFTFPLFFHPVSLIFFSSFPSLFVLGCIGVTATKEERKKESKADDKKDELRISEIESESKKRTFLFALRKPKNKKRAGVRKKDLESKTER